MLKIKSISAQITPLAICLATCLAPPSYGEIAPKLRICFFSLNNQTEVRAVQDLVAQNESPGIEVKEFVSYGDVPEAAFRKMAETGGPCDGLVISGHHRLKGFEGARVPGYFPTSSLEKLSCDPKLQEWFSRVRSVWLQGCATGEHEGENSTGLSEKFRALFPQALLFSWSGSAPSRRAPITIPFQLENLARLENLKPTATTEALARLLTGATDDHALDSWKLLRKSEFDGFRGISNPSAQAYPPLTREFLPGALSSNFTRRCALLLDSKSELRLTAIQEILASDASISENLETLMRELENAQTYPNYNRILRATLKNALDRRLVSLFHAPKVPLWKKIASYRVLAASDGNMNRNKKEALAEIFSRFLEKKPPRGRDPVELKTTYDRIFLEAFAPLPRSAEWLPIETFAQIPSNDALRSALRALIAKRPAQLAQILAAIARNPHADTETLHHLALQARAISVWNLAAITEKIRASGRAAAKTLTLLQ